MNEQTINASIRVALAILLSLPPLYLLAMIQYGAITFPYWDHIEDSKQIIQYFDGTLTFSDLLEPQNQSRPLFPRLIFIANAALTKWDLRSEYIYIYLTIYGTFAALLFALHRLSKDWPPLAALTVSVLIGVIACSPVGAMDHYWSLMLLATLCYFSTIVAMLLVSIRPLCWPVNILAAILAWIASYSFVQGLFLFPTMFLIHQMIAPRLFSLSRWSIFWLLNLIVCYSLYLPHLTEGIEQPPNPTLFHFLAFIPVYVGNPLGSLLWFPYMGAIDLPHTTIINGIIGIVLIGFAGFSTWRALPELRNRRPEALIFFSLSLYAAACTVVTAWGRANGDYAIASANSSRYSIFASYLLFGLIFLYGHKFSRRELVFTIWHKFALTIFLIASTVSYIRAVPVYAAAHGKNAWLVNVYGPHADPTDLDKRAYPYLDYFNSKRTALLRLGIGPYNSIAETTVPIYSGAFVAAIPLNQGVVVKQRFSILNPDLRAISFPIVTWAMPQSSYRIHWAAVGLKSGTSLGEGTIPTSGLSDWQLLTLRLASSTGDQEVEVTFSVEDPASIVNPVGLALYPSGNNLADPAVINGKARDDGSKVGFNLHYRQ